MRDALEVVQIQLSAKGGQLRLLEELAHDFGLELPRAVDHEGAPMGQPGDDVLLPELLGDFEDDLELEREGTPDGVFLVES